VPPKELHWYSSNAGVCERCNPVKGDLANNLERQRERWEPGDLLPLSHQWWHRFPGSQEIPDDGIDAR
jgi:hypothetical protein